jgi:hypothetical protein
MEGGPRGEPRYRWPATETRRGAEMGTAPEMRRAAEAGTASAEMHSPAYMRSAAEVPATHGMRDTATPAHGMGNTATAATNTMRRSATASASSRPRIGRARQGGRERNNGEDFEVRFDVRHGTLGRPRSVSNETS